jgi:hypothetical protein
MVFEPLPMGPMCSSLEENWQDLSENADSPAEGQGFRLLPLL